MTEDNPIGARSYPALPVIINLTVKALLFALALFLFRRTLRWPAGWLYWGMYAAWSYVNAYVLYRRDPALLLKRLSQAPGVKEPADKVFALASPLLFMLTVAVCGLRADWPGGAAWLAVRAAAFAVLAMAYWLASWTLLNNSFALKAVLLQPGQTAVSTGPYAFVRHPLYLAFALFYLCMPAALGSAAGFVPAAFAALAIIARTVFEDRFLYTNLAGYPEYSAKVRYRLVPGLW